MGDWCKAPELDALDANVPKKCLRVGTSAKKAGAPEFFHFDTDVYDRRIGLAVGPLKDLGVPHDDNEEAHAYLFEFVYRRFLEFLCGRGSAK